MDKVMISNDNLTNIANAIREKNNSITKYKPSYMAAAISDIKAQDNTELYSIVDRTIEDFFNDEIEGIGNHVFFSCNLLKSIECSNAKIIDVFAFSNCTALESVKFAKATTINNNCFYNCKKLTNVYLPEVTFIDSCAFKTCGIIETISLPKLTNLGSNAFEQCLELVSIDAPELITIDSNVFYYCKKLKNAIFPKLQSIAYSSFNYCSALETIDLPSVISIDSYSFAYCFNLSCLILRSKTLCVLNNISAFSSTGIDYKNGYIYVPSALIEEYKTATNWLTFDSLFRAIEDYPDICCS